MNDAYVSYLKAQRDRANNEAAALAGQLAAAKAEIAELKKAAEAKPAEAKKKK